MQDEKYIEIAKRLAGEKQVSEEEKSDKDFLELKETWDSIPSSKKTANLEKGRQLMMDKIQGATTADTSEITKVRSFQSWMRYASSIAIFLLVGISFYLFNNSSSSGTKVFVTALKGSKRVVLKDGSTVLLNKGAKLWYDEDFNRNVRLEGEGFFDISHNEKHPFEVLLPTMESNVKVLGTSFNINTDKNQVSLFSGSVEFSTEKQKTVLEPGQKVVVSNQDLAVGIFEPNKEATWRKFDLVLKEKPLTEVLHQLERWYGHKIMVKDPTLLHYTVSVKFEENTLEEALDNLAFMLKLKVDKEGDYYYLIKE
ncbi:FecR family protein [Flammeovirga sp. OC4]|uniref:FecR family protein n=1 Tax=Flammeovirga sp. OC4 TaxID=1382345 RepID=UPI0005C63C37|nr:FecR domain-containing protein [Flammeovirga sp. OC4]